MKTEKLMRRKVSILATAAALMLALGLGACEDNDQGEPASETNAASQTQAGGQGELKKETLQEGSGETADPGEMVSVHYTGKLENGQVFDSSVPRGEPFTFKLGAGSVIEGWEKGIAGMKVGEKRRLTIPPQMAYGERGAGPIPPNSTLIFDVELLDVKKSN